jgi:hypothetical protein
MNRNTKNKFKNRGNKGCGNNNQSQSKSDWCWRNRPNGHPNSTPPYSWFLKAEQYTKLVLAGLDPWGDEKENKKFLKLNPA